MEVTKITNHSELTTVSAELVLDQLYSLNPSTSVVLLLDNKAYHCTATQAIDLVEEEQIVEQNMEVPAQLWIKFLQS